MASHFFRKNYMVFNEPLLKGDTNMNNEILVICLIVWTIIASGVAKQVILEELNRAKLEEMLKDLELT